MRPLGISEAPALASIHMQRKVRRYDVKAQEPARGCLLLRLVADLCWRQTFPWRPPTRKARQAHWVHGALLHSCAPALAAYCL